MSSVSILIGGKAGQGIASVESLLTKAFKRAGFFTFSSKEFMSRIRGGSNTVLIIASSTPVNSPVYKSDIFIALDKNAFAHAKDRLRDDSMLIGKGEYFDANLHIYDCDIDKLATELGNPIVSNSIAAGLIFSLVGCDASALEQIVKERYNGDILDTNLRAIEVGKNIFHENSECRYCLQKDSGENPTKDFLFLSGTEAIGFGAIAGGCDLISSYPMSPSTGVLTFLAQSGSKFGICVEQAEDEIAAFQMGLGVWYGGGRAMTTTSGGGFALMSEGMSLSGMTETPMVVCIGQRPGPATGLPTRTEQGDLELALYAGHGEFPRVLLAPGDIKECFELARDAFNLADKYQIPVIILADQYLLDSYFTVPKFQPDSQKISKSVIETDENYLRYRLTQDGISPRGIPGFGNGFVLVDSDEHTEEGLITESMSVRIAQHEKRLRKLDLIKNDAVRPECTEYSSIAIVGWGSTKHVIREAMSQIADDRAFCVHFAWIYPLSAEQLSILKDAKRIIVVENNATGQFAKLLKLHGIDVDLSILKYDGLAFFADELREKLSNALKEVSI